MQNSIAICDRGMAWLDLIVTMDRHANWLVEDAFDRAREAEVAVREVEFVQGKSQEQSRAGAVEVAEVIARTSHSCDAMIFDLEESLKELNEEIEALES